MTLAQQNCLEVVRALTRGEVGPSFSEIAAVLGIGKTAVSRRVNALIKMGALRNRSARRGLCVVEPLEADIARLVAVHGMAAVEAQVAQLRRAAA